MRTRELVALLLSSYRCLVTVNVLWFYLTVPCVGLHYVIVVFPDHTHFLWSPVGKRLTTWPFLYMLFSCVFVTFPFGILGQVWYLIVSIPDLCLLPYIGVVMLT